MQSFDAGDFGRRLSGHVDHLFAVAYRLTNEVDRARDLAQESLLVAWERRDQLRDPELILPWARRICVNLFLQEERRSRAAPNPLSIEELSDLEREGRSLQFADDKPLPPELAEVDESIREIRDVCFAAMVHRLSLNQRAVFALVETFGLSLAEAAEAVGLSVLAAKALLGRARRHVIAYFDTNCSLMEPGSPCECLIWRAIINDRELLRAEARRRGLEADFGDARLPSEEIERHREKILAMFRHLPPRRPDPAWFTETLKRLAE